MPDPGVDWSRVRALFDELRPLDGKERGRRLDELEPALRVEVDALLDADTTEGPFDDLAGRLASPTGGPAGATGSDAALGALRAHLTDRYRIVREIGEGGMSIVYLAEDLRLGRRVAVKVLKPELAAWVGAGRFLAEIRTTAKLQHPHVLPLFDSGDADGFLFYVMPFVQDESLRQRLDREKQLPIVDAVAIAGDVAEALEYAHREGVVHRDVKPENILLTQGGALVADFGVALLLADAEGADRRTEVGLRVGTPRYMSPEQATGSHPVGPASDVYALGCVVYEMLTGAPPHRGTDAEAVMAESVSGAPAPVSELRASVPRALEAVVMRALAPIPADRQRSAHDFATALRAALSRAAEPTSRSPVGWLTAAGVAAVLAGALLMGPGRTSPAGVAVDPVSRQVTFEGDLLNASLSPDGSTVAFVAGQEGTEQRIAIQSVDGGAVTLAHRSAEPVYNPQWSPDNASFVFTTPLSTAMYVVRRPGVTPAEQVPSTHVYASWAPDGDRLLGWSAQRSDVTVIHLSTRGTIDSIPLGIPTEWVLGVNWAHTVDRLALALVTEGRDGIWTLDLASRSLTELVSDTVRLRNPVWSVDDRLIYYARSVDERSTEIWKVGVAPNGAVDGRPRRVTGPLPMFSRHGIQPPFSLSADGSRLLYLEHLGVSNLHRVDVADDGSVVSERTLTTGTAARTTPRLSPDGRRVAYVQADSRGSHVAVMDLDTLTPRQVTFLDGRSWSPAWSNDGVRIAFGSNRSGPGVWVVDAETGTTTAVDRAEHELGNHIAWGALPGVFVQEPGDRELRLVPPDAGDPRGTARSFGPELIYDPRPSPTGRFLALNRSVPGVHGLVVMTSDGAERRVFRPNYVPLGWTADERGVFAMPGTRGANLTEIHIVPLSGEPPRPWVTLPFGVKPWEVSISLDGRTVVAAVEDPRTDAWVVEGFDGRR